VASLALSLLFFIIITWYFIQVNLGFAFFLLAGRLIFFGGALWTILSDEFFSYIGYLSAITFSSPCWNRLLFDYFRLLLQ